MNPIYTVEQFKEYLSILPLGSEAVDNIVKFAEMQESRIEWQRKRCDVAAKMLGHDQINEMMDYD